jgi:hypothetical protein
MLAHGEACLAAANDNSVYEFDSQFCDPKSPVMSRVEVTLGQGPSCENYDFMGQWLDYPDAAFS